MAINLIRYEHRQQAHWGVLREGRITPIPGEFASTGALLRSIDVARVSSLRGESIAETEVTLLSPVTRDQQFVCQGANYAQHMIESGMNPADKTFNMIFTKATSCIVAADHDVVLPRSVRFLDYEVELGLVLRRDLTRSTVVRPDDLFDYVAGLVVVNDYSARDVQIPQMQFYKGKSFRTFGPVGPYLCLLEPKDMHLLSDLRLTLTVNGETRQDDNTKNLVFGPAETLTELSGVQDLYAGDLLSTGTPSGCALSVPSPIKQRLGALVPEKTKWKVFLDVQARRTQYLKVGDVVEAHIRSSDGSIDLGRQRNLIVAEQASV